jgi:hypothetical protein
VASVGGRIDAGDRGDERRAHRREHHQRGGAPTAHPLVHGEHGDPGDDRQRSEHQDRRGGTPGHRQIAQRIGDGQGRGLRHDNDGNGNFVT